MKGKEVTAVTSEDFDPVKLSAKIETLVTQAKAGGYPLTITIKVNEKKETELS